MPLDYSTTSSDRRSVGCRFYCLETSPKGSSLERFPMLSKIYKRVLYEEINIVICI
jgi:hypothetical protein